MLWESRVSGAFQDETLLRNPREKPGGTVSFNASPGSLRVVEERGS